MTPRIVLASLAVAAFAVAALLRREGRIAKAPLEFDDRPDPDEMAFLEWQDRIKSMIWAALNDWDDPAFGAYCERQFLTRSRTNGGPG